MRAREPRPRAGPPVDQGHVPWVACLPRPPTSPPSSRPASWTASSATRASTRRRAATARRARRRRASSSSGACSSRSCGRPASRTPSWTTTATSPRRCPATSTARRSIGLIAHVDTSPDAPGTPRRADRAPRLRRRPRSSCRSGGTVLDPARLPELGGRAGHDIVTSSGDTLLGADDKAGVAEIMTAVAHLAAHPELPRPDAARRLHARRGDRGGRVALRHRGLRRRAAPTRWTARASASCRTRRSPPPR